jgi:hypothetical protein
MSDRGLFESLVLKKQLGIGTEHALAEASYDRSDVTQMLSNSSHPARGGCPRLCELGVVGVPASAAELLSLLCVFAGKFFFLSASSASSAAKSSLHRNPSFVSRIAFSCRSGRSSKSSISRILRKACRSRQIGITLDRILRIVCS